MSICIVDTSVFCNILDVPNRNQDHESVLAELTERVESDDTLLLPLATIYETGNHIAQNGNGAERRSTARKFINQVGLALQGETPFTPTDVNDEEEIRRWLTDFPDYAASGVGFGDVSIIEAFNKQSRLHRARRVYIWSLDDDLAAYDRDAVL